ncbi:MAG: hypothetical protein LUC93_15365 [Planctomycetaceae bacterium]|nr:hypothetical protein [Planctomycetaceae bacterium]
MNEYGPARAVGYIPETVADLSYFLSTINTPDWHWLIRVVFASGFILTGLVYLYYRRRDDAGKS